VLLSAEKYSKVYAWNRICPRDGEKVWIDFVTPVKAIRPVKDGSPVAFERQGHCIPLKKPAGRLAGHPSRDHRAEVRVGDRIQQGELFPQLHASVHYGL
jgi:hypothetical protein